MTRWFLDTEFDEDGRTIELISIGLVSGDGLREYYAVSSEFEEDHCSQWVKENVLSQLPTYDALANTPDEAVWKTREQIAKDVRDLLLADGEKPEVWAYFADYDWVALCQLFGRMIDLPKGFPFYCLDLKQETQRLGVKKEQLPKQTDGLHDALEDARWNRKVYEYLNGCEK